MKLQELLAGCDFDDIMAAIDQAFKGASTLRAPLKQAYDMLTTMPPVASKKSIRYKILWNPESDEEYMGAEDSQFETTWEVCLGKEIVREDGVDLTDTEIAANCLVNLCLLGRYPKAFEEAHARLTK